MCGKVVNTHSPTIEFVPECYKTQKCVIKLLINVFNKTQEMCDRISDYPFSIRYVLYQYTTQQMCYEAVDDCLPALKFVPDWFVTSKIIKILFAALYADENVLYFNEDSSKAKFICNGMGILNIYLNNINLDDTNYDEDDPDTTIHVRLLTWYIKFGKRKELKKKDK